MIVFVAQIYNPAPIACDLFATATEALAYKAVADWCKVNWSLCGLDVSVQAGADIDVADAFFAAVGAASSYSVSGLELIAA